ncbi:MAG: T9SS type A sorting domain-containing protein, partial [Bacteroidales bacterium]|nr:T9SS type A sorting domain-containing protein [Bacteroidales bacterium]
SDTLIYANDTLLSNNGSSDFLLMKVDLNGNLIWANNFGGPEYDQAWGLTTDGQNIYLSGYFYEGGTFSVAGQTFTSTGGNDIFLCKIDQDGNFVWAKSNGSSGDDRCHGITFKNNYLSVTGTFSNSLNWGNTIVANANTEPFVGTISTDGVYIKSTAVTSSSSGFNWGYDIDGDNNGHYYTVGKFNSSAIAFNSNISLTNTNSGNFDGFIAKYGCFDGLTVNATDAGCSGSNDGQIIVTPNEGYGPFNYSWSNGATSQTISGLSEGNYTVTVSDNTGCSAVATAHITYHPPVSVSTQITNEILCNGDSTGQIVATVTDGFAPYDYSWSNGATTDTISNLPAGDYTITATDQCGNTATQAVSLTEPDSLELNLTGNIYHMGHNCVAKVTAHISGGTKPYSYEWYDFGGNLLGTNSSLWVWADDYYIIVVTDANGCVAGWYFYVPGCNKSMDVNDGPELSSSEQYPEADASFSFVTLPTNNGNSIVTNGGTTTKGNSQNQIFDRELIEGLKSLGIGPEVNAYPNPANKTLNISLIFPYETNAQIILLNSVGQTIKIVGWSQAFSYEKIVDVSNLSNGIYYLMVKTDFGVFKKNISIVH